MRVGKFMEATEKLAKQRLASGPNDLFLASNKDHKQIDNRLCVVWRGDDPQHVNVLVYGDGPAARTGGNGHVGGTIRTYRPGDLDGLLANLPRAQNALDIWDWFRESGKPFLIPVSIAKVAFGWTEDQFASGDLVSSEDLLRAFGKIDGLA